MKKIIAILVLSLFLLACAKEPVQTNDKTNNDQTPISPEAQLKEYRIAAYQFGYEPSTIEVNEGDRVKLILTTKDVSHGFFISEYGINLAIHPGKETTYEFVADKPGKFNFRCSIPCGTGHGAMTGVMIVK